MNAPAADASVSVKPPTAVIRPLAVTVEETRYSLCDEGHSHAGHEHYHHDAPIRLRREREVNAV